MEDQSLQTSSNDAEKEEDDDDSLSTFTISDNAFSDDDDDVNMLDVKKTNPVSSSTKEDHLIQEVNTNAYMVFYLE